MDTSRLKRELHPIPDDILELLSREGLMEAYRGRPPYQQNDYIGWIQQARLPATRDKRIRQMVAELRAGDKYMNMAYRGKPSPKQD